MSTSGTRLQTNNQVVFTKEVPGTEGYLSVSPNSLTGFEAMGGVSASAAQTVSIVGDNLPSNLTVSATSGFEVSTSSNGTYSTSLTLTPSNGSLRQMVYVRLSSNATPGNINGSMTLTSGSTSATVTLSGNVVQGSGTLYTITANANPTAGGTVNGAGSYYEDGNCTLTATANAGYTFANWTKDGNVVSSNATYSFTVTESADYVANFTLNNYNITATANPTAGGTVNGTGTFNLNNTCTLTATANTGYTFANWTKNGTVVSNNATYSFTVTGDAAYVANFTLNSYTVTATANPAEGGEVTFAAKGNRETLTYDFEDGTQGWTTLKGNTGDSPNNWMHNTEYPTSNNDFSTGYGYNSSNGFMLSESYISGSSNGSGSAVTPDNYLVSPQVRLGGSISFYAGARNTSYCAEKFSVMVSTTNNTSVTSFTTVDTWTLTLSQAGYNSTPYTVDLSAYSGMGYIAIRHWDCYDQWFLCVDDITIVEGESHSNSEGTYNYGESCTVTATPNTGYHFVNWTVNNNVVSSNENYTFTVTDDCDLVANFSEEAPSYTIVAKANPTVGGTVTGGGTFEHGESCTLTATPAATYTFTNWTKDGTVVSTNPTYTFTVTESADYQANFTKITYTITAIANPTEGGTVTGAGVYEDQATPHLIATPNEGYMFINWTENGEEVSTNPAYYFTADSNRDLVANFAIEATQTQPLLAGWNWFSTYIEMGQNGLALIEQALGSNGIQIKSQNAFVLYENGEWDGNLTTLDNATMYQIQTQNACNLVINSALANVEDHPITLKSGWNWIGYPNTETVDISTAFNGFTPANNDMVKGRNAYTTYIEGYGWWGTLSALTPGSGYMYKRNGSTTTFTYQTGAKYNSEPTSQTSTYWTPAEMPYADNASVMVTIDAANITLSEEVEVGAFVNDECRGAAKLMYVEPTNQYVAFLTVFGDDNEKVSFKIYHNGETFDADEQVNYTNNMVVGKVTEPFVLHLNANDNLVLTPNPVEKGQVVNLGLQSGINLNNVRIDVYNAFGANIRTEHNVNALNGITTAGVYTVKVTDAQGNTYFGKLIVK